MTPTAEQSAIIDFARTSPQSLLVSALAGAAKTTTLAMICHALPAQPILSLAFNKRVAEEMAKRLPGHVACKTLNGLGHGIWAAGRRLKLNTRKDGDLLKALLDGRKTARDTFRRAINAVAQAKSQGYIPEGHVKSPASLITREDFMDDFEIEPDIMALADETLVASIAESYRGTIDFSDQIYMPTLFGGTFPKFPLVLLDEAQDLSPLNHSMLDRLVTRRLIAVGDPYQSIYGFRGSVSDGMTHLAARFAMAELPLSTSFRCPKAVVLRARSRAPTMTYPDWATEGTITTHDSWHAADIPDGAAIICRNNAPLFSVGFALLRAGRGIKLSSSDIGPAMLREMRGLGPESTSQADLLVSIDRWQVAKETEVKRKKKNPASIVDRAECFRIFAGTGPTLRSAIAHAEGIFKAAGPIQLLTGHKAKGLEWDHVFHLDSWRVPSEYAKTPEELEQESNLRYVIETRAKSVLAFIDAKTYAGA